MVGRSAVSLLSNSLKLYFKALEQQLGFRLSKEGQTTPKKEGFLAAYRDDLGEVLETDWANCIANFDIIEQIVLARNRAQHGEHLSMVTVSHDDKTLRKHRDLVFASETELGVWLEEGGEPISLLAPRLEITEQKSWNSNFGGRETRGLDRRTDSSCAGFRDGPMICEVGLRSVNAIERHLAHVESNSVRRA